MKTKSELISELFEMRKHVLVLEHRLRYLQMFDIRNGYQQKEHDALAWSVPTLRRTITERRAAMKKKTPITEV